MAVQRSTIGLVATTALSWSFVLAIQVAVGALVIASVPARRVPAYWMRSGMVEPSRWTATGVCMATKTLVRLVDRSQLVRRSGAHTVWRRVSIALAGIGVLGLVLFSREVS